MSTGESTVDNVKRGGSTDKKDMDDMLRVILATFEGGDAVDYRSTVTGRWRSATIYRVPGLLIHVALFRKCSIHYALCRGA